MNKTIIIKDDRYLQHVTGAGHPENHHRLEEIYSMLKGDDMHGLFQEICPRAATHEELALIHTPAYIKHIEKTAGKPYTMLDPDTHTSAGSWEAAVFAAGGVIKALDLLIASKADNGFALIRPPGHHAETAKAMGFCIFNNIAIGTQYLLQRCKLSRILIVDWDLHHGNGTQNCFYKSPEVLYFSVHQYPYYPGSGSVQETGAAEGRGYTVNVPLPGGQGDADYLRIFQEILHPITDEYKPEFILVSAGYDTYFQDPLGAMEITPPGFYSMTASLMDLAAKYCGCKILFALEGGYHLQGITASVKKTLIALVNEKKPFTGKALAEDGRRSFTTDSIIKEIKKVHARKWRSLG